jgi:hypothetical protein
MAEKETGAFVDTLRISRLVLEVLPGPAGITIKGLDAFRRRNHAK